ncbi:hypothetical protein [Eisenibacter elegans]|uniref:hypothetical protein n=1 Tax=Eisenibacter elegans TaxID=997 RepID=UPI0004790BEF|nr:hypothetical protein [Eisenibacter elegans]
MPQTLLLFLHSLLIAFWVSWLRQRSASAALRRWFWPALGLKLGAGWAFGWMYMSYYQGGDTVVFFQNSRLLAQLALAEPQVYWHFWWHTAWHPEVVLTAAELWYQPRVLVLLKPLSLLALGCAEHYWLMSAYFSLLSFAATWGLLRKLEARWPAYTSAAVLAFLLWPTVSFWTSGLQKEALAWAAIAFIVQQLFADTPRYLTWSLAKSALALSGLLALKFYYAAALIGAIGCYWMLLASNQYVITGLPNSRRRPMLQWLLGLSTFGVLLGLLSLSHPHFNPSDFFHSLVVNHNTSYHFSHPAQAINYTKISQKGYYALHSHWTDLLYNAPQALFGGLFRPILWVDSWQQGWLQRLAMLENTLFLGWGLVACLLAYKQSTEGEPLVAALVIYAGCLALLLAFASPNFGSLLRYRVSFYPFLLYLWGIPLYRYWASVGSRAA